MRIALTLDRDADTSETNDYLRSLVEAGVPREAIEIVTPLSAAPPGPFDALLLGGGVDVDPARYGQAQLENGTVEVDAERDAIDFDLFEEARRRAAPVLGICRGLQVVNVALGGTLVQDIPTERPSDVVHDAGKRQDAPRPRGRRRARHAPRQARRRRRGPRSTAGTTRRSEPSRPGLAVSGDGARRRGRGGRGRRRPVARRGPVASGEPGRRRDPVSRRLFAEFVRARERRRLAPADGIFGTRRAFWSRIPQRQARRSSAMKIRANRPGPVPGGRSGGAARGPAEGRWSRSSPTASGPPGRRRAPTWAGSCSATASSPSTRAPTPRRPARS